MPSAVLEALHVSKRFPGVQALNDVSFPLWEGEIHALVGENGAGKSTLMRILSGIVAPDEGTLRFSNRVVHMQSPHEAHGLGISLVPQELSLIPSLTAAENIMLGAEPRRGGWIIDGGALRSRARAVADSLQIDFALDEIISRLSVAQRQLVQIARGVVHRSKVLILDEPTRALTDEEAGRLFAVLHDLRKHGTVIAYISHRLEEVLRLADRITVLRDGVVIGEWPKGQVDEGMLIRAMAGRRIEFRRSASGPQDEVLLDVDHLSGPGFQDVSFAVRRGEILGLGGLVGSGRSEVAWTIMGLHRASRGRITYKGAPLSARGAHEAIKRGLGLVPEERKTQALFALMSVSENIALPLLRLFVRRGFLSPRAVTSHGQRMTEALGIKTPDVHRPVMFLSGGNQQKTVLARWLNPETELVILDEPTQGVDVAAKAEIHELIRTATRRGAGVLLISSEADELLGLAHRVVVLHRGRLAGTYPTEGLTKERLLQAAMGVKDSPEVGLSE